MVTIIAERPRIGGFAIPLTRNRIFDPDNPGRFERSLRGEMIGPEDFSHFHYAVSFNNGSRRARGLSTFDVKSGHAYVSMTHDGQKFVPSSTPVSVGENAVDVHTRFGFARRLRLA